MTIYVDFLSFDPRYAEHVNAGDLGGELSEPTATLHGVDCELDLAVMPGELLTIVARGKRLFPNQQFPVLFEPGGVSAIAHGIQGVDWRNPESLKPVVAFLSKVIERGECLGVDTSEI